MFARGSIPIDLMVGFAYLPFTAPTSVNVNGTDYYASNVLWGLTGPGSFLNASFEIGVAF
jgi:hypothetical protein